MSESTHEERAITYAAGVLASTPTKAGRGLVLTLTLPDDVLDDIAARVGPVPAAEPEPFVSAIEAAEFLACPISRIRSLTSQKRIPHHRDGSRVLYRRSELETYIANGGARRA